MGLYDRDYVQTSRSSGTFASRVYGWMTVGLGVTTLVSLSLYFSGLYRALFPLWWVWCFATFGVSLYINARLDRMSVPSVARSFLLYSVLDGLLFGTLVPVYAYQYGGGVVWAAFGTAALIFGLSAGYGAFTKSDLTQLSKILMLAMIGFMAVTVIFAIASLFVSLPMMYLFICYVGLVLFVGLTAVDAQNIRRMAASVGQDSTLSYKLSLIMALKMYINVVMIFWYLLQIFSSSGRRD